MFMADTPYQVWEALLYAFFNSFPYMLLVLFSFRSKWRCSGRVTFVLLALVTLLITGGTVYRLFSPEPGNPLYDIAFSALYIVFIFAAVRQPVGKLVFTVLVLMNLGNLVIVLSKCLEGMVFPETALLRYRWTYALMMAAVLCAALPLIYALIFRGICRNDAGTSPRDAGKASDYMWRWLWLIPTVFYLIWAQHFYSSGKSTLENALDPISTGYLLLIDTGSVLIYRVIVRLADLQERNRRLQTENHILLIQKMQYENLKTRAQEVRQARHDLRHHLILLKNIRDKGDLGALDELLSGYPELEALDRPLAYCGNETVNSVLSYFADQTQKKGIAYTVRLDVPENLSVNTPDLTVLFGNLLENAVEACAGAGENAFIRVSGGLRSTPDGTSALAVIVENACAAGPEPGEEGAFRSTKHPGDGIGIVTVRGIVRRYNGACSFLYDNGVFTSSVLLNHIGGAE